MKRLDQKTALVTGGASGLGKAIAQRLASEGARVVISDVQTDLGLRTATEGGFRFLPHDVRDEKSWDAVVREVEAQCGALRILVNNAGIVGPMGATSPENTPLEVWRQVFAINVEGVFLGCRTGIAAMRRGGGGAIINISSVAGLLATPYNTAYGASKATVRQLTQSVAQHCAAEKLNIRCNSVHPGGVDTAIFNPLWQAVGHEQGKAFIGARHPIGRMAEPSELGEVVLWLASDRSSFVTGAEIVADGGITSGLMRRLPLAAS